MWHVFQSVTSSYDKVWQILQFATGITKCDRYFKVRQQVLTKCDRYYSLWQILQSVTEHYYKVWQLLKSET